MNAVFCHSFVSVVAVELLHQRKVEIISELQEKDSTVDRAGVLKLALCLKSSLLTFSQSNLDKLLYLIFFVYKIRFINL